MRRAFSGLLVAAAVAATSGCSATELRLAAAAVGAAAELIHYQHELAHHVHGHGCGHYFWHGDWQPAPHPSHGHCCP